MGKQFDTQFQAGEQQIQTLMAEQIKLNATEANETDFRHRVSLAVTNLEATRAKLQHDVGSIVEDLQKLGPSSGASDGKEHLSMSQTVSSAFNAGAIKPHSKIAAFKADVNAKKAANMKAAIAERLEKKAKALAEEKAREHKKAKKAHAKKHVIDGNMQVGNKKNKKALAEKKGKHATTVVAKKAREQERKNAAGGGHG